jgi:hypothetical protein
MVKKGFRDEATVHIFNLYWLSAEPAHTHVSAGLAMHFFNPVTI